MFEQPIKNTPRAEIRQLSISLRVRNIPVILGTELEVDDHDSDLRAADNQDDVDEEEEGEESVDLVFPDRLKEELR